MKLLTERSAKIDAKFLKQSSSMLGLVKGDVMCLVVRMFCKLMGLPAEQDRSILGKAIMLGLVSTTVLDPIHLRFQV
jgi:PIN domain nuclease of toxin-antitoxin system